ncbi:hypothetical protein SBC2_09830 [Caballeronia sp. SBC2]|nr:hypothetical protein SBC2_09830 [Caballeronia sp. SBC2]
MDLETEKCIIRDHPVIYRKLEPRLPSGERFECKSGWGVLLRDLSTELEKVARATPDEPFAIVQVKEKFGALRVYFEREKPYSIWELLNDAYDQSRVTCELCGKPGTLTRVRPHIRVVCHQCSAHRS